MVINLGSQLEAALIDFARRKGVTPEVAAVNTLRDHLLATSSVGREMSGNGVF